MKRYILLGALAVLTASALAGLIFVFDPFGIKASARELTPKECRIVRGAIYGKGLSMGTMEDRVHDKVLIPWEIQELYKEKPEGVLDLLIRIADGANPFESMTAATYGLELAEGTGCGRVCFGTFKEDKYDSEDWGQSLRMNWISRLRAVRAGSRKGSP